MVVREYHRTIWEYGVNGNPLRPLIYILLHFNRIMNCCKNVCRRTSITTKGYGGDIKRCSRCEVYFDTKELKCACCGTKLRIHSRWHRKPMHYY